ncbi:MAG: hypothetical protein WAT19_03755 [Ferruginibacter sp.]
MTQTCKNCGNHFKGIFCNNCGQKFAVERFSFRHIFSEVIHAFTHADKGFLSLLKKMTVNPGLIAYEYIVEFRRKKYFNLFTFFVLITAIAAYIENKDVLLKEDMFRMNNIYGIRLIFYNKLLSAIIIPAVALAVWLIHFPKRRLLYSEYTVFAMLLMSLKAILDIIANLFDYAGTFISHKYIEVSESAGYAVVLLVAISIACFVFHKKLKNGSWWQSMLCAASFIIIQYVAQLFVVWAVINRFSRIGIFKIYGIEISDL